MFVAAMLDAMPGLAPRVMADTAKVLPRGLGQPLIEETTIGSLRTLRFGLAEPQRRDPPRHAPDDTGFPALVRRIEGAMLENGTAPEAIAILTILAEAEAKIHGVPVDHVHFHELADWDSLLDVVAAGSIAAALHGAHWSVSALPQGGGVVKTAHGLLPVPAPATTLILEGFVWRDDGVEGERVTPTGAAILKHLIVGEQPRMTRRLVSAGTGAGTRTLPGIPNILRALVFEPTRTTTGDRVAVIDFEIDDMTGEEIAAAATLLRAEAGVIDVSIAERWGKKGRPMQSFQVIARPEAAEAAISRCFAETSTIGLRVREDTRVVLARELREVGGIRLKSVWRPGMEETRKAESDDLTGETLAARRAWKQQTEDTDQ
ncbi:MAG: LarC family nickel insertion protein [Bauldia sp.]|nr:LarC family nickel insertion protein [Bauldia sp.]